MAESWKPGTGQTIDALYAWVATEPDGGEGVCSAQIGDTHRMTGHPVRLVRFGQREDIEVL